MEQMTQRINVFGDRESLKKVITDSGHRAIDRLTSMGYTSVEDGMWMAKILGKFCNVLEKQIMPKGENFAIVKDRTRLIGMCEVSIAMSALMLPKWVMTMRTIDETATVFNIMEEEILAALYPTEESEETT